MTFTLRPEALVAIRESLTRRGGTLKAARQVKSSKKYRLHLTADLADGSSRVWYSEYIKYPKSNKQARDWSAEAKFAAAWRPSHSSGSAIVSEEGVSRRSDVTPAPPREKRKRDCQPTWSAIHTPPAKRAAREGAGRPRGSFGRKRLRSPLDRYRLQVEQGQLFSAHLQVRDLGSAMLAASQEVDRHERDWRPAFLKRQSNRGVGRKEALRKLAKHRSQLEKEALASAACTAGWEKGVEYFRAVVKECHGAVAATSAGLEVSVDPGGVSCVWMHTAVVLEFCSTYGTSSSSPAVLVASLLSLLLFDH